MTRRPPRLATGIPSGVALVATYAAVFALIWSRLS